MSDNLYNLPKRQLNPDEPERIHPTDPYAEAIMALNEEVRALHDEVEHLNKLINQLLKNLKGGPR